MVEDRRPFEPTESMEDAERLFIEEFDTWVMTGYYLYSKLLRSGVSRHIGTGGAGAASRDFFGFAQGKAQEKYVGFSFGKATMPILDSSLLLIEPISTAIYQQVVIPTKYLRASQGEIQLMIAAAPGTSKPRDVLFINKATPEDDEFVLWIGPRLEAAGYKVFADILSLEHHWREGTRPFGVEESGTEADSESGLRRLEARLLSRKTAQHRLLGGGFFEISGPIAVRTDPNILFPCLTGVALLLLRRPAGLAYRPTSSH